MILVRGKMLWFNEVKDFGFISTDEGERLYVHGTGFAGGTRPQGRCAGMLVEFHVREDEGGRKAAQVALVPEVAQRRARRRHGRW